MLVLHLPAQQEQVFSASEATTFARVCAHLKEKGIGIMKYLEFQELSEQTFYIKMTQVAYPALSEAQVPVNANFDFFPFQAENI